jgi:shikimate kinase
MTTLLIGHRGTGKTAFLNSLESFAKIQSIDCAFFDLDSEIEKESGKSVADWFAQSETAFRLVEKKTFAQLMVKSETNKVIALGAGFEGPLPKEAHVIWLRRETDVSGRVFSGRPRLNPELSPLDEYMNRYHVREHRFRAWAHEQLFLPEGYQQGLEDFVLKPHALRVPYDLTLLSAHFRNWVDFWEKRSTWGIRRFEIRDDLLSNDQALRAREKLPPRNVLNSIRTNGQIPVTGQTDWAMEIGKPQQKVDILSAHERQTSLAKTLAAFASAVVASGSGGEILKLAVEIENFEELKVGHNWWRQDPSARAFLPRSKNGRWRWYRSLFGPSMPVHFYREDEGSAADQPLLWQTLLQPPLEKQFAAVLGSPVHHSRTPIEHLDFFKEKRMPVVAIEVSETEFPEAFKLLIELGLTHAAVTSPLKNAAFEACHDFSLEAEEMRSVNTLIISGGRVKGHNTDVLALKDLIAKLPGEIWLWGGGGVRSSVRAAFPNVKEFSAQTGLPRPGTKNFISPEVLIWASGRSNDFQWPPESVKVGRVLDLNYSDDSPGLEWAMLRNLPYQSGLKMFKLQADFQRRFWQKA